MNDKTEKSQVPAQPSREVKTLLDGKPEAERGLEKDSEELPTDPFVPRKYPPGFWKGI